MYTHNVSEIIMIHFLITARYFNRVYSSYANTGLEKKKKTNLKKEALNKYFYF